MSIAVRGACVHLCLREPFAARFAVAVVTIRPDCLHQDKRGGSCWTPTVAKEYGNLLRCFTAANQVRVGVVGAWTPSISHTHTHTRTGACAYVCVCVCVCVLVGSGLFVPNARHVVGCSFFSSLLPTCFGGLSALVDRCTHQLTACPVLSHSKTKPNQTNQRCHTRNATTPFSFCTAPPKELVVERLARAPASA